MSGKKIACKTIHLSHDDNELLEAIAHAKGMSCSQLLGEWVAPHLAEYRYIARSVAKVPGISERADRSARALGTDSTVHEDRPSYSLMH